ncbi:MAG: SH3 domain-containing protein [bacterium]|nr:SH3 domain-containing protein [bacterium]
MRKFYVLIPVFLVLALMGDMPLSAGGDNFRQQFDRANQLYEEGNYSEALPLYHEVEKEVSHWKLFYNTGNCYYKLNDFVRAKIYYLRAQRLQPFDVSIQKNIDIVNKGFNDNIEAEKPDFISRVALRIESVISMNIVSVVLLITVILLNLFIFILLKRGKSRFRLYGVSFSLVIVLVMAGYHMYRTGKPDRGNTAVIVKVDTQLRSGPGENNTVLFKVNPGVKVKIIEESRNWVQVSASAQVAGWIPESSIERI